jgi:hypothetical protein
MPEAARRNEAPTDHVRQSRPSDSGRELEPENIGYLLGDPLPGEDTDNAARGIIFGAGFGVVLWALILGLVLYLT